MSAEFWLFFSYWKWVLVHEMRSRENSSQCSLEDVAKNCLAKVADEPSTTTESSSSLQGMRRLLDNWNIPFRIRSASLHRSPIEEMQIVCDDTIWRHQWQVIYTSISFVRSIKHFDLRATDQQESNEVYPGVLKGAGVWLTMMMRSLSSRE